jgi:ribosome maturation factor RimP
MAHPLVDKIRVVVAGPVEGAGYELVDVEWKREPIGWVCRVLIDWPDGRRIGVADCERVTRLVSAPLDVADVIPQAYHLEVSSPGLDRPLTTAAHFRRFRGHRCKLRLVAGVDGRRNFSGQIGSVSGEGADAKVQLTTDDALVFDLPLRDLDKANLVYDFDADVAMNAPSGDSGEL